MSSEELAIIFNNTENKIERDKIFEEIYVRFEKLMYYFVNKHVKYGLFDEDELVSFTQVGLLKGVMAYSEDKKVGLSTVIYRYIQTVINNKYDYTRRYGRDELRKRSISINYMIEDENKDTESLELINHDNSEDTYFKDYPINMKSAVEYGLSKVNNQKVKEYIVPCLIGNYTQMEVADLIGTTYQNVQAHIRKFKQYVKKYVDIHNINVKTEWIGD